MAEGKDKVVTVPQLTEVAEAQKTYIDAMDQKLSKKISDHQTEYTNLKETVDNLKDANDEYDIPERAEASDISPIVEKFNVPEE